MSYSLVRASLDLVEYETDVNPDKKKKKKRQNGILNLIPAHQRILPKGKNSARQISSQKQKKLVKNLEESVQDKVQTLLSLSNRKLDGETAERLFTRTVKQPIKSKEPKPTEAQSAFTEEDFAKFAAEYIDD